jgi:isopentenyl phosphate kinase
MLVVKIGGAAITQKNKIHTLNENSIDWFCKIIEKVFEKNKRILIVHGAG